MRGSILNTEFTDRQQRELDYHREHAKLHKSILSSPFSWEVLKNPEKRWWNAYWGMYEYLASCDLRDRNVLVVGCGFGDDALRLAKLGARVSAFDISPDSLEIAKALALREGLEVDFEQMPAEQMLYSDNTFDYVLSRDILHHVDIPKTIREIVRVSKPDAVFVVNEIYSHSFTDNIRHSTLVEKILYPKMRRLIYGPGKPYITEDERKLSESDLEEIAKSLQPRLFTKHFNFLVTRVIPDRFENIAKVDRLLLRMLRPFGHFLAGRVLFSARIKKAPSVLSCR
jgi:ubiquinone/menaquinone biosynthesis C-methylase UbiE